MKMGNRSYTSSKKRMMIRYSIQLEDLEYPEMKVIEVDDDIMIKTCEL